MAGWPTLSLSSFLGTTITEVALPLRGFLRVGIAKREGESSKEKGPGLSPGPYYLTDLRLTSSFRPRRPASHWLPPALLPAALSARGTVSKRRS